MKVNIFVDDDYRTILKSLLLEKKAVHGKAFTFERLAKACRLQKSYLSRALGGHGHLSDDQLFLANEFLGVPPEAARYLFLAHALQRTTNARRRAQVETEMDALRQRHSRSDAVLEAETLGARPDLGAEYFLDPNAIVVHMCLTVPRFREQPKLLATQLGLAPAMVSETLAKLSRLGLLVENDDGKLRVLAQPSHVAVDSPYYRAFCVLQRTKTLERLVNAPVASGYHFSVVFSADRALGDELKRRFLELLKDLQPRVTGAAEERVFQMNFDVFAWTE